MSIFMRNSLLMYLAMLSMVAFAEPKLLDNEELEEMTAQSGLSIDIESKLSVGEVAYQDGGFVLTQGIKIGGHTDSLGNERMLDNFSVDINVAGSSNKSP